MRAASLALVALLLVAAGCGDDEQEPAPATPTATATATSTPASTSTPAADPLEQAIWPGPETATDDPLQTARRFVEEYVGVEEPALGEFRQGDSRSGEVEVFRKGEDGRALEHVVATITLRQLSGDGYYVTAVSSPEVEIEDPEALEAVSSPLTVSGRGRGFEGNIVIELHGARSTKPIVAVSVTAGSMAELEPFEARLEFDEPDGGTGAILAKTGSGIAAADGFAALPVRFSE